MEQLARTRTLKSHCSEKQDSTNKPFKGVHFGKLEGNIWSEWNLLWPSGGNEHSKEMSARAIGRTCPKPTPK